MKNKISFLLLLTFSFLNCHHAFSQEKKQIARDVSVKEFNQMIVDKPGTILDVRTKGEVSKGAIKGAVHYDIFDDNFESQIIKLDKSKPVYVYCAVGGRSGEAMEMMQKKGFSEAYNLAGGYNAWIKEQKK